MDTNRRTLLRRLGATGGITLLAGCTGDLPVGESDGGDGSPTADDNESSSSDEAANDDGEQSSGDADPSISIENQTFSDDGVTVSSVAVPDGGFVVVYDDQMRALGVSEYLGPGTHDSVTVELVREDVRRSAEDGTDRETIEIVAVPHHDSNDTESFDYRDTDKTEDGWYDDGGTRVQSRAVLALEDTNGDAMLWHALLDSEIETFEESRELYNDARDRMIVAEEVGDLRNRVETTLASGDGPEMYRWAQDWVGQHYERDFLYDASHDLEFDPAEQFSSPAVEAITAGPDDAVVGLPVSGETVTLLYNEAMVDEPPETFAEMETIMQEYHDPNDGRYGLSHPIDAYFASAWLHAFGGYYFRVDENGRGETGLDLDETKRGMEFLRDRIWPYVPADLNPAPQQQVFEDENAPFAVNGPWSIGTFEDSGIDVGVTSLPTVDGHTPSPYTGTSMWYFSECMYDDEDRRDAALDYAEWIATSEERQKAYADAEGGVPVLRSVGESDLDGQVAGFKGSYDDGVAMPSHPGMSAVWVPTEDAMYDVLQNGADIDSRFDEAAATIRSNWRR